MATGRLDVPATPGRGDVPSRRRARTPAGAGAVDNMGQTPETELWGQTLSLTTLGFTPRDLQLSPGR